MRVSKEQAMVFIESGTEDMVLMPVDVWLRLTNKRIIYISRHAEAMHIEAAYEEHKTGVRKKVLPNPDFAEKLMAHAKEMGITTPGMLLTEIRRRSGIRFSVKTVRWWLKGTYKPRRRAQKALRDALGFDYDYDSWPEA